MKKKIFSLVLIGVLCLTVLPISSFAAGWNYYLPERNSHWGSSSCTTGYPKLKFTINNDVGEIAYSIEKYSSGTWQEVTDTYYVRGNYTDSITINVANSSTQYRVFVTNDALFGGGEEGTVSCTGSN